MSTRAWLPNPPHFQVQVIVQIRVRATDRRSLASKISDREIVFIILGQNCHSSLARSTRFMLEVQESLSICSHSATPYDQHANRISGDRRSGPDKRHWHTCTGHAGEASYKYKSYCRHITFLGNFTYPIRPTAFVFISQQRSNFRYIFLFPVT